MDSTPDYSWCTFPLTPLSRPPTIVPRTGLYAISFCLEGTDPLFSVAVPCVHSGEKTPRRWRAVFEPPAGADVDLTLPSDLRDVEGGASLPPLTSIHVGRVLFLPEGTSVSVTGGTGDSAPAPPAYSSPRWMLRYVCRRRAAAGVAAPAVPPAIELFPVEAQKKPHACMHCGKRTALWKGVREHVRSVHAGVVAAPGDGGIPPLAALPGVLTRPLRAVLNDDHLVVLVKPQGLAVMGNYLSLCRSDLLLPFTLPGNPKDSGGPSTGSEYDNRPLRKCRPVHRLDAATGGLLILAKTVGAEIQLRNCFRTGGNVVRKRYRAVVFGRVCNDTGTITQDVDGKPSVTQYEVAARTRCADARADGWISTVDLMPTTGRRHQLRKHMKAIGHSIWGDRRYGPYCNKEYCGSNADILEEASVSIDSHARMCLWALEIQFPHPVEGKDATAQIDEPVWYSALRHHQERLWRESSGACSNNTGGDKDLEDNGI